MQADIAEEGAELPVEGVSPRNVRLPGDSALITYRVRLDVPGELVLFVSRLPARHRGETGTRKNTRSLGCYRRALFVLAWYRDKADIPRLGAGFGLSQATSYRYVALRREALVRREALGVEGGGRPSRWAVAAAWWKLGAA